MESVDEQAIAASIPSRLMAEPGEAGMVRQDRWDEIHRLAMERVAVASTARRLDLGRKRRDRRGRGVRREGAVMSQFRSGSTRMVDPGNASGECVTVAENSQPLEAGPAILHASIRTWR